MLTTGTARAAYGFKDRHWDGLDALISMLNTTLGQERVLPVSTLDWSKLHPSDGLLVIYPAHGLDQQALNEFLRRGGRVGFLDDFGASSENLAAFGIRRVAAPANPKRVLRHNRALPFAIPVSRGQAGNNALPHPVVQDVPWVIVNHGMGVIHPSLTPILAIPDQDGSSVTFAVAGQVAKGRLIAAADASIVINEMLRYRGNRGFVQGLARYLVADDTWGKRGGRLFIVADQFSERGTGSIPSDLRGDITTAVRSLLRNAVSVRRAGIPSQLLKLAGALLLLSALVWLFPQLVRRYRDTKPRYARAVVSALEQGGLPGRQAMLQAPTTPPALVMLELKAALSEAVAAYLHRDMPITSDDVLAGVKQALHLQDTSELRALLVSFSLIETSVAAGSPRRVRDRELQQAMTLVSDILERLHEPTTRHQYL